MLITTLKKCLKLRGISYRTLARHLAISESSVKRLFANHRWPLHRLEEICEVMGLSIFDLMRLASDIESDRDAHRLTIDQEKVLANDADLLIGFHLLLNGWTHAQIRQSYRWSEPQLIKILTRLDKAGLIELLPGNRVLLKTATVIHWRPDGPVRQRYQQTVLTDFLKHPFDQPNEVLAFEVFELSTSTVHLIRRRLENLRKEVAEFAAMDRSVPTDEKESVALLLATRTWVFDKAIQSMEESYRIQH